MYDFVQRDEVQRMIEAATQPLLQKIELLESLTDEWVETKVALKLTGIKSRTTLALERERPSSLLQYEGIGKAIRYSRASCIAFTESKRLGKTVRRPLLHVAA